VALVLLLAVAGCGSSSGQGSGLVDGIAKRGVGAFAEGRWRCKNTQSEVTEGRTLDSGTSMTIIAISRDGRFSFQPQDDPYGTMSGTWSVDGLRLRLAVPWHDDGENGFYRYAYRADQDPPTRLRGGGVDNRESVQDLKVEITEDRIRLTQKDADAARPDRSQPNYGWDVDCRRDSHDPGKIGPTVPPSNGPND